MDDNDSSCVSVDIPQIGDLHSTMFTHLSYQKLFLLQLEGFQLKT